MNNMKNASQTVLLVLAMLLFTTMVSCSDDDSNPTNNTGNEQPALTMTYPIVDTGQEECYDNNTVISAPPAGAAFCGQDAQYSDYQPSYTDNGDGTITDNVTGLMWSQGFTRVDYQAAAATADTCTLGGYDDWRVPTNKELYSLIIFSGNQGSGSPESTTPPADAEPFIDTGYFDFEYPSYHRYIDAQYVTTTEYVYTVMDGQAAFFGVNFADGRIKGYPQLHSLGDEGQWYLRMVRGNTTYGVNEFVDNGDGTITDLATGLMWTQSDNGAGVSWENALEYAETLEFAGYSDWRLPNVKELHSILDYSRAPDVTSSAAIDPMFAASTITNEMGNLDYPYYWTSTTFEPGRDAVYIAFGRALGYMNNMFMDVHGAGAQRTDPKTGEPSYGFGPQGDVRRVYNYVRCVRNIN